MLHERIIRHVNDKPLKCFAADALQAATNGWAQDRKVGSGGFGDVYRGELTSYAATVAVKRLRVSPSDPKLREQFHREIAVQVGHENQVAMHGYCPDPPALVFEFMGGGSLQQAL